MISELYSITERSKKSGVAFLFIFVSMDSRLCHTKIETPIGEMIAIASDTGLCLLEFDNRPEIATEIRDLKETYKSELVEFSNPLLTNLKVEMASYFRGDLTIFKTPLLYSGTDFQVRVWHALQDIPYGETRTYKEQSEFLGDVKAIRAVASANGKNKLAIVVPCHRVIGTNGNLTGYAGGIERKRFLLNLEHKFGGPKDLFTAH